MTDDKLRAALDTLRSAQRTEPDDRFWQGWDAALASVDVALNVSAHPLLAASATDEDPRLANAIVGEAAERILAASATDAGTE